MALRAMRTCARVDEREYLGAKRLRTSRSSEHRSAAPPLLLRTAANARARCRGVAQLAHTLAIYEIVNLHKVLVFISPVSCSGFYPLYLCS
jgi:hypothetical protein